MSKPVRLPDYLHAEVERLAKEERRSMANMVQVLLEQALRIEKDARTLRPPAPENAELAASAHFKPDFKK